MENDVGDRINLLYPNIQESISPLPRHWNIIGQSNNLELSMKDLCVTFRNGVKTDEPKHACSLNAIPTACGIYYYEVKVLSKTGPEQVSIGLTTSGTLSALTKENKEKNSSRFLTFTSVNGQPLLFTVGDTIGCGVNFYEHTFFCTKNGEICGWASKIIPKSFFAVVGLRNPGDSIIANFGQDPFIFAGFEQMRLDMRKKLLGEITNFPLGAKFDCEQYFIRKFISNYLRHNAYSDTAAVFSKCTDDCDLEGLASIDQRKKIKYLIFHGDIAGAIKETRLHYPGALEENKSVWLMLLCQQFIEKLRCGQIEDAGERLQQEISSFQNDRTAQNFLDYLKTQPINQTLSLEPALLNINHTKIPPSDCSYRLNCTTSVDNDGKVVVNVVISEQNTQKDGDKKRKFPEKDNDKDDSETQCGDYSQVAKRARYDLAVETNDDIDSLMMIGRRVVAMFEQLASNAAPTDDERQMVENTFALVAYKNPETSPLSKLLDIKQRKILATRLNSAILKSMNFQAESTLSLATLEARNLLKRMSENLLPESAFITLNDIMNSSAIHS